MEDRFEKFIRENREAFDFREPDPLLWEKMESGIRPRRVINWRIIISRAAVVLIIFAASYAVHEMIDNHGRILAGKKSQEKHAKEIIIPELQEAELYYSGLIDEKQILTIISPTRKSLRLSLKITGFVLPYWKNCLLN
jgi:hypothetical protein